MRARRRTGQTSRQVCSPERPTAWLAVRAHPLLPPYPKRQLSPTRCDAGVARLLAAMPPLVREYQNQMAIESKNMFEKLQAYQKNPNPQNKKELEEAQAAFNEVSALARAAAEEAMKPRAPAPAPAVPGPAPAIAAPAPAPAPAAAPPPEESTMTTSTFVPPISSAEPTPAASDPKDNTAMSALIEPSDSRVAFDANPVEITSTNGIVRPKDPEKPPPPPKRSLTKRLTGRCKVPPPVEQPGAVPALEGAIETAAARSGGIKGLPLTKGLEKKQKDAQKMMVAQVEAKNLKPRGTRFEGEDYEDSDSLYKKWAAMVYEQPAIVFTSIVLQSAAEAVRPPRPLHGDYMAVTWRLHDGYMAVPLRPRRCARLVRISAPTA